MTDAMWLWWGVSYAVLACIMAGIVTAHEPIGKEDWGFVFAVALVWPVALLMAIGFKIGQDKKKGVQP